VAHASATAQSYGERILGRLDLILEAVREPEFAEYHPRYSYSLTANVAQDLPQIPTTEQWELEYVSCTGGATVTINEGSDLFRYAKQFTNADAHTSIGLVFGGGTAPNITSTGNATPVGVVLQFKRMHQRAPHYSTAPGLIEARDTFNAPNLDPVGRQDDLTRHTSPHTGTSHRPLHKLGHGNAQ